MTSATKRNRESAEWRKAHGFDNIKTEQEIQFEEIVERFLGEQ